MNKDDHEGTRAHLRPARLGRAADGGVLRPTSGPGGANGGPNSGSGADPAAADAYPGPRDGDPGPAYPYANATDAHPGASNGNLGAGRYPHSCL